MIETCPNQFDLRKWMLRKQMQKLVESINDLRLNEIDVIQWNLVVLMRSQKRSFPTYSTFERKKTINLKPLKGNN